MKTQEWDNLLFVLRNGLSPYNGGVLMKTAGTHKQEVFLGLEVTWWRRWIKRWNLAFRQGSKTNCIQCFKRADGISSLLLWQSCNGFRSTQNQNLFQWIQFEHLLRVQHFLPLSKAMRNSRLRCNSLMNSSFCRKRAMRSSSRYCFSFLSCSVAPVCAAELPAVPTPRDREPDSTFHWFIEDTEEEEEDEGCDRLLWELWEGKKHKGDYNFRDGVRKVYWASCATVMYCITFRINLKALRANSS